MCEIIENIISLFTDASQQYMILLISIDTNY